MTNRLIFSIMFSIGVFLFLTGASVPMDQRIAMLFVSMGGYMIGNVLGIIQGINLTKKERTDSHA